MKKREFLEILGINEDYYIEIMKWLVAEEKKHCNHLMEENTEILFSMSLYSFYPLLFKDIFNIEDKLHELIMFSRYYSGWLFLLDKIYDDRECCRKIDLLIVSLCATLSERYLQKLIQYCKVNSTDLIDKFRKINDVNMKNEESYFTYDKDYTDEELQEYCKNKYILAKNVVYLCYLSDGNKNKRKILEKLFRSHDYFAIARQYLDEIEDYKEDYKNGKFNIFAYKLQKKHGRVMEDKIIQEEMVSLSRKYMLMSKQCIVDIPECGWNRFLTLNIDNHRRGI